MSTTAKGIPELDGTTFIKDGPTNINAALVAIDGLLDTRAYTEVLTSQTTTSTTPADLSTAGPSVTITVASDSLVIVEAQVTITAPPGNVLAKVFLAEDGTVLTDESSANFVILSTVSSAAVTLYTRSGTPGGTTARILSSAFVFPTTAGSHTYKLMYAIGTGATAGTFSNRKLSAGVFAF